jgi:hypothetical protein
MITAMTPAKAGVNKTEESPRLGREGSVNNHRR